MNYSFFWIFLAFLLPLSNSNAQWIPTNGPFGYPVTFAGTDSNRIFSLSGSSLFISLDTGRTWSFLSNPVSHASITSFVIYHDTLFVGTNSGILRSIDLGKTWTAANNGIVDSNVLSLGITNGHLFAGTDSGIFRSITNGNSWTKCSVPFFHPSQQYVFSIGVFDSVVFASSLALWVSTDAGTTWALDTGIMNYGVSPMGFVRQGNSVYAATGDFGMKRSTDNGISWVNSTNGLPRLQQYSTSFTATTSGIFVGTSTNGVFRSTDNGGHWKQVNAGLLDTNVTSIVSLSDRLLVGSNFGTFISEDNGDSWKLLDSTQPKKITHAVVSLNGTIFAGSSAGVFRSNDSGSSWTFSGLLHDDIRAFAIKGDTLFAGGGGIYRSVSGGKFWENTGYIPSSNNFTSALWTTTNYLFAGLSSENTYHGGIYRSSDNGNTWTWKIEGFGDSSTSIYTFASIGDRLFAGTDRGVYISIDEGNSWSLSNPGLTDTIYALLATHDSLFAGSASNGVYFSTNFGTTWVTDNFNLTNKNIRALTASNNIFTGTAGGGTFVTVGNGNLWKEYNTGLSNDYSKYINSYALDGTEMFAATADGVWKLSIQTINGVRTDRNMFNLYVHPNPFSSIATISFDLPSYSMVSLKIINALGKEVGTALSEEKLSEGHHDIQWNANELPNGVYFYRLTTDSFSETKKLVLLR